MQRQPMVITHEGGLRFAADIRGHRLIVDQPPGVGEDTGPTPLELLGGHIGTRAGDTPTLPAKLPVAQRDAEIGKDDPPAAVQYVRWPDIPVRNAHNAAHKQCPGHAQRNMAHQLDREPRGGRCFNAFQHGTDRKIHVV